MSTDEKEERFGAADIVDFVRDRYDLGRTSDGLLIAIPHNPRAAKVAREVGSLRREIGAALYNERHLSPGRETVGQAIETLKGLASEARVYDVAIRSADLGASIHLDLADQTGRFVEISRYGWEIRDPAAEDDPDAGRPVFRRSSATVALPVPEPGGSRDDLRRLLGFDSADDPRWRLIWGWLVASLFASIPRPILWTLGQQGSGKSTRAKTVLNIIDPAEELQHEPGKNERDDSTSVRSRYIPTWDNIGRVSATTSDWLCRLVTGVQIDRRALYTDDDVRTMTLRRTGIATSIILPSGLGPDALERLVLVEFAYIAPKDRLAEDALKKEFRRLHPRILGALLDDVAGVLRYLSEVREERRPLPRMADYAQVLIALDRHLGLDESNGYAATYVASVSEVLADSARTDPIAGAIIALVERWGGRWEGTAEDLVEALKPWAPDDRRAWWPRSPRQAASALKKVAEPLRAAGIDPDAADARKRTHRVINGRRKTVRLIVLEAITDAEDGRRLGDDLGDDLAFGTENDTQSTPTSSPTRARIAAGQGAEGAESARLGDEATISRGALPYLRPSKSIEGRGENVAPAREPARPSPSSPIDASAVFGASLDDLDDLPAADPAHLRRIDAERR